jgi:hypothetical protein
MTEQDKIALQQTISNAVQEILKGILENDKIAVVVPIVVLSACQITNVENPSPHSNPTPSAM